MPVDLALKNGKVYVYGEVLRGGLAIDEGRIVRIARDVNLPSASREMDLDGLLVLPGLVDAHVHLRGQGLSYKEDFLTGTAAAANGGVTLVADMPNNRPVTMDSVTLRERMGEAARKAVVNVAFYSAFPEKTGEIQRVVREGAKGFKLYMSGKIGGLDPNDDEALVGAFREAARLGVPVSVHAEDGGLLESAFRSMGEKESCFPDAYLKVHSSDAEVRAVSRVVGIAERSGARVHICHLSTKGGVEVVSSARQSGLSATCEVTPHHLLLSSSCLKDLGAVALTDPPLRSEEDIRSLWSAIQAGTIDILASDHAPHAWDEKVGSSIFEVAPGIAGVETLLPLMLTQVSEGRLSLSTLVRMTSGRPADIFGLRDRGRLKEGCYADLVVVDLKERWKIDSSKFLSKAKFSPFDGWEVKGRPKKTFVNGCLVMDEGEILAKPGDGWVIR